MHKIQAASAAVLLALCASSHAPAGAQFENPAEQRVELSNFDFTPHELHLRAGRPYNLILANSASGGHNFTAREFFAAARVQPGDAALVHDGKIEVPGKATRTVRLIPVAGTYKLTCTHTMHTMFGMKGQIVVE